VEREAPAETSSPSARISNAVVQLTAKCCGRGPTRARTTITATFATIVLEDVLTRSERTLVAAGEHEHVRQHRAKLHGTIRDDVVALVEAESHRRSHAYLCDTCPDTGVVVHTVLFQPLLEVA